MTTKSELESTLKIELMKRVVRAAAMEYKVNTIDVLTAIVGLQYELIAAQAVMQRKTPEQCWREYKEITDAGWLEYVAKQAPKLNALAALFEAMENADGGRYDKRTGRAAHQPAGEGGRDVGADQPSGKDDSADGGGDR